MRKKILLLIIGMSVITGCSNTTTEDVAQNDTIEAVPEEEQIIYGTDYESTWGDLIEANGGEVVWETLTPAQQALVHYPKLDLTKVYWTPEGTSYHAVDWCYTLERSKTVLSGTYGASQKTNLNPCSKCVGE